MEDWGYYRTTLFRAMMTMMMMMLIVLNKVWPVAILRTDNISDVSFLRRSSQLILCCVSLERDCCTEHYLRCDSMLSTITTLC